MHSLAYSPRSIRNKGSDMSQSSMTKLLIALMATMSMIAIAGCKKKSGADGSIAKLEGFEKQMCACKDKACADRVQDEMTKWGADNMKAAKPDDKPDPDLAKKSQDIMG